MTLPFVTMLMLAMIAGFLAGFWVFSRRTSRGFWGVVRWALLAVLGYMAAGAGIMLIYLSVFRRFG
jgi:hypothetical protein